MMLGPTMYCRTGTSSLFSGKPFARREIFNHRILAIPKPYPDAQLLLELRGTPRPVVERGTFYQLNLYSTDLYGLPDELFEDREINWHHQQFGLKGLVGAAGLWVQGDTATVTTLQSDLCQQLFRHDNFRGCKTQVETHFRYWYAFLFNAVLDFSRHLGLSAVRSPTGQQIVSNTKKQIAPDLFLRIYNHPPSQYFCQTVYFHGAEYWEISIERNADRIVALRPAQATAPVDPRPHVCIFHDIEENIDTTISPTECADNFKQMLEVEKDMGIPATYCVVGKFLNRKREEITASNARHAIGFHSYNHNLADLTQLKQCRDADLRIRGYRPPKSKITPELSDCNLSLMNFEWLANSSSDANVRLEHGIAKIPIHIDDYQLFTGRWDCRQWEAELFERANGKHLFGLGLHDCYAGKWLDHYPDILDRLGSFGVFASADEICDQTYVQAAHSDQLATSDVEKPSFLARAKAWLPL